MSPLLIVLIVVIAIALGVAAYALVVVGGLRFTFRQLLDNRKVSRYRTPDDAAPQPPEDDHDFTSVVAPHQRHDDDPYDDR